MGENPSLGAIFMSLEEAKKVKIKFNRKLCNLRTKSRLGDQQAPLEMIRTLTEKNNALAKLGYRTTSEDEPGRINRLVKITPEWIAQQRLKASVRLKAFKNLRFCSHKLSSEQFQLNIKRYLTGKL